jgi:hypothetical protein
MNAAIPDPLFRERRLPSPMRAAAAAYVVCAQTDRTNTRYSLALTRLIDVRPLVLVVVAERGLYSFAIPACGAGCRVFGDSYNTATTRSPCHLRWVHQRAADLTARQGIVDVAAVEVLDDLIVEGVKLVSS